MRALLVVNPAATTTTPRMLEVLVRALGSHVRLEVASTKRRGHAAELAAAARSGGCELVIALGGDGTVNEVVNGLLGDDPAGAPALAVVPGGSTNVFARALGLPAQPVEAAGQILDALRERRRRRVGLGHARSRLADHGGTAADAPAHPATAHPTTAHPTTAQPATAQAAAAVGEHQGRDEDRWFTFCAGLGFDADVIDLVERRRADGRTSTPTLFISTAVRYFYTRADRRHPALTLRREGAQPVAGLHLAIVCNARPWTYLGERPVDPCPAASFEGGLDLLALRRLGTVSTARHVAQLLSGGRHPPRGRDVVTLHDEDEFILQAARPVAFQLDGDAVGQRTAVRLRGVRDALDVLV